MPFARRAANARCSQGVINVNDLLAVLGDYGKRTDISKTDSNADGVINVSDLLTLLANYGATCDAGEGSGERGLQSAKRKKTYVVLSQASAQEIQSLLDCSYETIRTSF